MAKLTLRSGHVQPVWAGHPWIFAQAIGQQEGQLSAGDEVSVHDPKGNLLGRGLFSPNSAIRVRLFTRDDQPLSDTLLQTRVRDAQALRERLGLPDAQTTAYRLINAEGDDLPGVMVDRYGDSLVVQLNTIGMVQRRDQLVTALGEVTGLQDIRVRHSARALRDEMGRSNAQGGSPASTEQPKLDAQAASDSSLIEPAESGPGSLQATQPIAQPSEAAPPEEQPAFVADLSFRELGIQYDLPGHLAQKTGYYLDQRPLRERVAALSNGLRVFDGYCYVGSLGLAAARSEARHVVAVDRSRPAVEVGRAVAKSNELSDRIEFRCEDARRALANEPEGSFDLVICDPPKLAPSKSGRRRAGESLRKLARTAARATRPGGLVVLCSCSAAVGLSDLRRAVALGARDAGRRAVVLERLFQGPDHPVPAAFPEGQYLTTLVLRVD